MINPHEVKVGDVLILDPDYDRRIGAARLKVHGVRETPRSQSGISFWVQIGNSTCTRLDAGWFTERAA